MKSQGFGPWAMSINDNFDPQLSTFWKRRMNMLRQTENVYRSTTRHAFWLGAAALVICALPTFYFANAMAQGRADKGKAATSNKASAAATGARKPTVAARQAPVTRTTKPSPWEYKVVSPWDGKPMEARLFAIHVDKDKAAEEWKNSLSTLEKWLNDHGKEGWELVSIEQPLNRYIFKRLKPSKQPSR